MRHRAFKFCKEKEVFTLNEDAKKKLKEKMGAAVGEEQLEKVAGGYADEISFIMNDLVQFDPHAVHDYTHIANLADGEIEAALRLSEGATELLKKYVNPTAQVGFNINGKVSFKVNGQAVSFDQMRKMIQDKAKLKAAGAGDFEIMY